MTDQQRLDKYFEFKCYKGFKKLGLENKPEYEKRLKFEIETIRKMGFCGYFLIVADFLDWSRESQIPIGPGRGSAAGSLASYCLGITNLDPLKYGLLFERFLNPDRISMPDIDCDFCEERRDEVIQYVVSKYGREHVAQIGTYGTMKAKGAIRDVTRTLGYPIQLSDKLSKLIPPPEHGKPIPLEKSYTKSSELNRYHNDPNTQEGKVLNWADKVEETIRNYGIHASGVVISPIPLTKLVPLTSGRGGEQASQFEMNNIEDVGLIKFDFLGLRTLTVIDRACKLIKEHHGVSVNMDEIALDDPAVFHNLSQGDNIGIFQLETSSGIRDLLIQIQPTELEDIIALVAMYRPGPLASNGMKMYLNVRAGRAEPEYLLPDLEPILKSTAGWIIYQEQVMQMARALAGYTPGYTDDLRKAIGKKLLAKMASHEKTFVEGGVSNGHNRDKMQKLWEEIKDFGAYGFNKSHAAAYGLISYHTAWLKTHYPVEFMCAALTSNHNDTDTVIKYINDCKRLGIQILPPDINESRAGFHVTRPTKHTGAGVSGAIRFGLSAIKNLGDSPVGIITDTRGDGFENITNFASRVDLGKINKRKLESLVGAGAFDSTDATRTSLLAAIDNILKHKTDMKKYVSKMETYTKRIERYTEREAARASADEQGTRKPAKLKEPVAPVMPETPVIPDLPEMGEHDLLASEKDLLGFYISGHPLDTYESSLKSMNLHTISNLNERDNEGHLSITSGARIVVAGVIVSVNEKVTKAGRTMAYAVLEDKTGQLDITLFGPTYANCKELIRSGKPIKIEGKIEHVGGEDDPLRTSVKLKPYKVTELIQGKVQYEPLEISINPSEANTLQSLLNKYEGKDHQVNVSLCMKDGTLFRVKKVYSIGGNRNAFLRELGRLNL